MNEASTVQLARIRGNVRSAEITKNPPTEKTHTFIGQTKIKGWKKSTAPKNALYNYKGKNAIVIQRDGEWWVAIPKEKYKEMYHGDIEHKVQKIAGKK